MGNNRQDNNKITKKKLLKADGMPQDITVQCPYMCALPLALCSLPLSTPFPLCPSVFFTGYYAIPLLG